MLDLAQLQHFHFLRPWWLLALIPSAFCYLALLRARDGAAPWRKSIAPHLLGEMIVRKQGRRYFNPVSVSIMAAALMILALAGPSWTRRSSPFAEDEAVLVIALDLSTSMDQTDVQPTRLERAKQKIHDLLELREGSRSALVVCAGSAHGVIPLTNDRDVMDNLLQAVSSEMMPRPGKFPEKALPIAEAMLRGSPVPGTLLLVSDGLAPGTEKAFGDFFGGNQHQLLIWGVGTAEVPEDSTILPLEREKLAALAASCGGAYQDITIDKSDVDRLYRRIDNYLSLVDDETRPWVDAGYYLLLPILLILMFWFRKGWTLSWVVLAALLIAAPQPAVASDRFVDWWLTPDQQGRWYFERGEYTTAAERFDDIAWKAVAYYHAENFTAAAELFSRIETADGLFNLANAYAQSKNYVPARDTYDRVLALDPDHAGALKNRQIIQKIIDDINRMSESQQPEEGEQSKELGDAPKRGEGADQKTFEKQEIKQYSADEILNDPAINELWMRQVQQDPARFLALKFQMQLQRREQGEEPP